MIGIAKGDSAKGGIGELGGGQSYLKISANIVPNSVSVPATATPTSPSFNFVLYWSQRGHSAVCLLSDFGLTGCPHQDVASPPSAKPPA